MGYRLFTLATFTLLLVLTPASGTEELTTDETWWNNLDEGKQLTAVQAATDIYESGFSDGVLALHGNALHIAENAKLNLNQAALILTVMKTAGKQTIDSEPRFPDAFGTYLHGISDFYANHPEAARATIGEIIGCLASRARTSCEEVAQAAAKRGSSSR